MVEFARKNYTLDYLRLCTALHAGCIIVKLSEFSNLVFKGKIVGQIGIYKIV